MNTKQKAAEAVAAERWRVISNLIYLENFSDPAEGMTAIAEIRLPPRKRTVEGKFLARVELVAAAPDLLAACRVAFERSCEKSTTRGKWTDADQKVHDMLRDAIEKAAVW